MARFFEIIDETLDMGTDNAGGTLCDGIHLPTAESAARLSLLEMLRSNRDAMQFFRQTVLLGGDGTSGIAAVFCLLRSGGRRCLVTEFIAGGSLARCWGETGSEQAVPLLRWLQGATSGSALFESDPSQMALMHSDIELLDFGFAKLAAPISAPFCGTIVVTPEFVAPRTLVGPGAADVAKVCSAGITLYEMLTNPGRAAKGSERLLVLYQLSLRPAAQDRSLRVAAQKAS